MSRLLMLQSCLLPSQALLLTDPLNIRYLTGFTGSSSYLLLTASQAALITDYRYIEQAQQQCRPSQQGGKQPALALICRDRASESLGACIRRLLLSASQAPQQLALEYHHLTMALYQELGRDLPALQLTEWQQPVEQRRAVKDATELSAIRRAVAIAEQALAETLLQVRIGMTEQALAGVLEQKLFALGAEALAFPTILLSGPRSALPHGKPTERRLQRGDFLLLDFGAVVDGYRSDITRTYLLGSATEEQRAFYQTVYRAQQAALAQMRPGLTADALNQAAAEVLAASPFAAYAGEGIGHGVGLALHEYPLMRRGCEAVLAPGMVVTVEPGLYQPGFGGVRIEDDVLITEHGIEILTQAPKELSVLCAG